ncbi:MAG: hypothetical protein AAF327_01390 [Cyanobacteria bacterium P01_A01_bin.37]
MTKQPHTAHDETLHGTSRIVTGNIRHTIAPKTERIIDVPATQTTVAIARLISRDRQFQKVVGLIPATSCRSGS